MKKKWVVSILALAGSGVYLFKKWQKKEPLSSTSPVDKLVNFYETEGYNVHLYNDQYDLMLFHPEQKTKKHVFFHDGSVEYDAFATKMQTYYLHFTNEFFFVTQDIQTMYTANTMFETWIDSLSEETIQQYGRIFVCFQTMDDLIGK